MKLDQLYLVSAVMKEIERQNEGKSQTITVWNKVIAHVNNLIADLESEEASE